MKKHTGLFLIAAALGFTEPAFAQYPDIPAKVKQESEALMKEATRRSDSAWQVALPIIKADQRKGKVYVPWAARPTDLPQANGNLRAGGGVRQNATIHFDESRSRTS